MMGGFKTNILITAFLLSAFGLTACSQGGKENTVEEKTKQILTDTLPKVSKTANKQSKPSQYTPGPGDLTPAILYANPSLSGPQLKQAKISPDGAIVTVLQGRAEDKFQQDLWAYDLKTGEARVLVSSTDLLGAPEVLSAEEKNRRERVREYGNGIVSYSWDAKGEKLLFPLGGDVYLYDLKEQRPIQVTKTQGYETDARVSKSGALVTYVRDNELFVSNLEEDSETQLSSGASEHVRNATASFVVQEELDRSTGYWLSPNEDIIAYTQIDESNIAVEERIEFGPNGITNVAQRYPFAGSDNAAVKLGVVSITGGLTNWLDLGDNPDIYLARVYWSQDGKTVYAGVLSRDQKSLKLYAFDPLSGARTLVFEETSKTWINVSENFKALKDGGFLWTSERGGFRHIYRYDKTGKVAQLTKGNWPVQTINCVDEDSGDIYFTGWRKSALERYIMKVSMNGGEVSQISQGAGRHSASFSKNCARYIGTFSNKSTPPQTAAYDNTGKRLIWLNENKLDENHPYAPYLDSRIEPQFGQLSAEDGTKLDYALYKPKGIKSGEKRPAITLVYGGPGVQNVHHGWGDLRAQLLADNGFVVFQLDNRGAANRGKAFEDHLYRALGTAEVADQAKGAQFLTSLPYVDGDNMGIYGWSYGGFMVLQMLGQTDLYKAGVAGAPVTDWALYDTAYTERYLGDPRPENENYTKGAYDTGSIFTHIDGITEPVLLMHGMSDDNVVFRHSIKLMDVMNKRGAHNLRQMLYPGEKHGFRGHDNKVHREQEILDFFKTQLKD